MHDLPEPPERLIAEINLLRRFVTDRRWERMQTVLAARTRYITVVVEDIYQPHNASAVLRSCDAFGVQDVHIVENRNSYRINPGVELGTSQWLTLHRWGDAGGDAHSSTTGTPHATDDAHSSTTGTPHATDDAHSGTTEAPHATERCIGALRTAGYRIVATTPHREDVPPEALPLSPGPVALLFGTEKDGLTQTAMDTADEYLRIPMNGFVESLNISVSAAIALHTLTGRLRNGTHESDAGAIPWPISSDERMKILHTWLFRSVPHARAIVRRELA